MSSDEILTIRDVASLLKIGKKTAYTMAQPSDLPGFKVRGQWRFRRADLNAWIQARVDEYVEVAHRSQTPRDGAASALEKLD